MNIYYKIFNIFSDLQILPQIIYIINIIIIIGNVQEENLIFIIKLINNM